MARPRRTTRASARTQVTGAIAEPRKMAGDHSDEREAAIEPTPVPIKTEHAEKKRIKKEPAQAYPEIEAGMLKSVNAGSGQGIKAPEREGENWRLFGEALLARVNSFTYPKDLPLRVILKKTKLKLLAKENIKLNKELHDVQSKLAVNEGGSKKKEAYRTQLESLQVRIQENEDDATLRLEKFLPLLAHYQDPERKKKSSK